MAPGYLDVTANEKPRTFQSPPPFQPVSTLCRLNRVSGRILIIYEFHCLQTPSYSAEACFVDNSTSAHDSPAIRC